MSQNYSKAGSKTETVSHIFPLSVAPKKYSEVLEHLTHNGEISPSFYLVYEILTSIRGKG